MSYKTSTTPVKGHHIKHFLVDDALSWWHSMNLEEQFYKTIAWLKDQKRNVTDRHPHKLTVDEIVSVYQVYLLH